MEFMDILIRAFISACGAGILTLIVLCIKWLVQIITRDKLTLDSLSYNAFYNDCKMLMNKDEITKDELENHEYLYKTYKARGLNGTGEKMHQLVMEKPVRMD